MDDVDASLSISLASLHPRFHLISSKESKIKYEDQITIGFWIGCSLLRFVDNEGDKIIHTMYAQII